MWLVVYLGTGLVCVLALWVFTDWRKDVRQAQAVGRKVRAVINAMGRHNVPESEDRTEPKFTGELEMLPVGDEPPKYPRSIPVQELLARTQGEGHALRLNWRREDEQHARGGGGTWEAGDFPTAVLPVVRIEEP